MTGAVHGETSGISGTAALLPTLSPGAVSGGKSLSEVFPVYGYAEVTYVNRVSDGLELGVRAVIQVNTAELLHPARGLPEPEGGSRQRPDNPRGAPIDLPAPITPFGGITVFGRFNAW